MTAGSPYRDTLLAQAGEFALCLRREGFAAEPDLDSLRDYSLRVSVRRNDRACGRATIYYSPARKRFTFRPDGVRDARLAARLEKVWMELAPAGARETTGASEAAPGALPGVHIYVDGSCLAGQTGYGAVILRDGRVVREISGRLDAAEAGASRQVAGEIRAVEKALAWCRAGNTAEVHVHYDYRGLEKWVTGAYRSNLELTRNYRDNVRKSGIRIHWHKVKSHSGDRWNDAAYRLARRGAGETAAGAPGPAAPDMAGCAADEARAFARFLAERGVPAGFKGVFNGQYARLEFCRDGVRAGFFDLYNTARKPFSPYLHGFGDAALREKIAASWAEFRRAVGQSTPPG